jgi:hypothetical protein
LSGVSGRGFGLRVSGVRWRGEGGRSALACGLRGRGAGFAVCGLACGGRGRERTHTLSLSLSLSHTHTRTHARTHTHTHTPFRTRRQVKALEGGSVKVKMLEVLLGFRVLGFRFRVSARDAPFPPPSPPSSTLTCLVTAPTPAPQPPSKTLLLKPSNLELAHE